MSQPLREIPNHHAATCGDPPVVNGDEPHLYIGYFENEHGEQWIFTRDRKTGIASLRGGDIGWNTPVSVIDGITEMLTLNPCEAQWLESCLASNQAFARR